MQNLNRDERIIRELAVKIVQAANHPGQIKKAELFLKSNDLNPERPMVLLDPQNGWNELVTEKDLLCEDEFWRDVENELRRKIFRIEHIQDDTPILPEFPVSLQISKKNAALDEHIRRTQHVKGAYEIMPSISDIEDIKALQHSVFSVDREAHREAQERLNEVFFGLLDVPVRGISSFRCGLTRLAVHMLGLQEMMFALYDEPDLIHALMSYLTQDQIMELDFYQNENLFSVNNRPDHITGSGGIAYCHDLPFADDKFTGDAGMLTAWGESQEFISVSPEQFGEFVLPYQVKVLNRFGLVDYGCCEPLDKKFDLVINAFPRLKWVSISPWCDIEIAVEKLEHKYIYVYKPNPSLICSENPDWDAARRQVEQALQIMRGKSVHIVMKDTSTFHNQLDRPLKWVNMVREIYEKAWS